MDRDDPFESVWLVIGGAIALIVLLGFLELPPGWVTVVLGWVLPAMVLGAVAAMIAGAIAKELPPALATGTVVFALTLLIRALFWVDVHLG